MSSVFFPTLCFNFTSNSYTDSHERKKFTGPGLFFACLSDQILVMLPSTLLWKLVDSFMPDFCCQFLQCIAVRPDGLGDCLELNKYWIKKNTGRLPLWAFCFGGYRTCCWWGEGLPWPVVAQLHVRWTAKGTPDSLALSQITTIRYTTGRERNACMCECVLIHANVLKLCNRKYSLGGGGETERNFPSLTS